VLCGESIIDVLQSIIISHFSMCKVTICIVLYRKQLRLDAQLLHMLMKDHTVLAVTDMFIYSVMNHTCFIPQPQSITTLSHSQFPFC